jgi:hypothetical protein
MATASSTRTTSSCSSRSSWYAPRPARLDATARRRRRGRADKREGGPRAILTRATGPRIGELTKTGLPAARASPARLSGGRAGHRTSHAEGSVTIDCICLFTAQVPKPLVPTGCRVDKTCLPAQGGPGQRSERAAGRPSSQLPEPASVGTSYGTELEGRLFLPSYFHLASSVSQRGARGARAVQWAGRGGARRRNPRLVA